MTIMKRIVIVLVALLLIIPFIPLQTQAEAKSGDTPSTVATLPKTDWTQFWTRFRQHASWRLQWRNDSGWKEVNLVIQRAYPTENKCKITLIFDAPYFGDYRLLFGIDYKVRHFVQRLDKFQYQLTYREFEVIFNWSDVMEIPNLIVNHGIKEVGGVEVFWFSIRRNYIPKGTHLEIDPSIIGTSTTAYATGYIVQRKSFYANGRFWVFYTDGTNVGYRTSTDITTWGDFQTVRSGGGGGYTFSIWFDGTYIHYVYATYSNYLYYRRGTPETGGTITWCDDEQTVEQGASNDDYKRPYIAVDSVGEPWIGYTMYNDSAVSRRPYVTTSDWSNGSWHTRTGFPHELSTTKDTNWGVALAPMTSGRTYVVWCRNGQPISGKQWNGASWEATRTTTSSIQNHWYKSLVNVGDNVHMVFSNTTSKIIHTMYNYSTNSWDWEKTVQSTAYPPVLSKDGEQLYCFWADISSDHVYYKTYTAPSWGSLQDWINEETDELTHSYVHSCFYEKYGGYIGLVYMTKLASPYNIRFASVGVTAPTIGEFTMPSTVYANEFVSLIARINDEEGVSEFVNATVELTGDIILKWDEPTDTFTKYQDPQGLCDLGSGSEKTTVNSTSYELKWVLRFSNEYSEGAKNIVSTNTLVYDTADQTGTNSQTGLFTFQHTEDPEPSPGPGPGPGPSPGPPPTIEPPKITPAPIPKEEPSPNLILFGAGIIGVIFVVSAVAKTKPRALSKARKSMKKSQRKQRNPKWPKSKPLKPLKKKKKKPRKIKKRKEKNPRWKKSKSWE